DLGGNATGVTGHLDIGGTVALARRLVPDAEHIAIVIGASDNERAWYERVYEETQAAAPGINVIPLLGLEKDELVRRVASLPNHTVLIWGTYRRDPIGTSYPPNEVFAEVHRAAAVPIFGLFEYDLGSGIVGGQMLDINRQGEEAGKLLARIVNGESAS